MDANGSRLHLLLGAADWETCAFVLPAGGDPGPGMAGPAAAAAEPTSPPWWDAAREAVTLPTRLVRFPGGAKDVAPSLANRRGAAADAFDNWYWIDDEEQGILVKSAGTGTITRYWSTGGQLAPDPRRSPADDFAPCTPAPPPPLELRGLAVTSDHYLVVGVLAPPGLLVFDLHAGGPPRQMLFPDGFAPFDFAARPGGGVWILDRDLDGRRPGARLWALDRRLQVIQPAFPAPEPPPVPDFRPLDGGPPPPSGVADSSPSRPSELAALDELGPVGEAVAVEALPDGSVLILDNGDDSMGPPRFSRVWRYVMGPGLVGPFGTRALADLIDELADRRPEERFSLRGHDFAFLPAQSQAAAGEAEPGGRLLIVSQDGNQAYAFWLVPGDGAGLRLEPLREYRPMRLFGGRGLVTAGRETYYDSRGDWIPLAMQPRPGYEAELTVSTPLWPNDYGRHAFDGRDPNCVWHRLMLDGCIPPGTEVQVWSRAANAEDELRATEWQREPGPYRRREGSELPYLRGDAADSETWELLFQRARGRYLQLRLRLQGDGRRAPRLRALRAYYPRFSYVEHYLPAVYREDAQSASFLDRFLANLEGLYTSIEDRVAAVQVLFDAQSAPAEYLEWLASWFDVQLDRYWDERRRRLFLAHAPELFSRRGTVPGLIQAIRLATDPCPDESLFAAGADGAAAARGPIRIVEHFLTRRAPGVVFGDPSDIEGPGLTTPVSEWMPEEGAAPLHQRFRDYLRRQYGDVGALNAAWGTTHADFAAIALSPTRPAGASVGDWERFLRAGLGFTYAPVDASAAPAYRGFLARRYGDVAALNQAYGLAASFAYAAFDQVPLPSTLPAAGRPLRDWIQFVSVVVPTIQNAHRFTVLVPTAVDAGPSDRGTLAERVRRVVELEKPAHTLFEVKEYWAAFRLGEARLGFDTLVDRGSRLRPAVLDETYLAGSYLVWRHPWDVAERWVLGRDLVGEERPL